MIITAERLAAVESQGGALSELLGLQSGSVASRADPPDWETLQGFTNESGRAGRLRKLSWCIQRLVNPSQSTIHYLRAMAMQSSRKSVAMFGQPDTLVCG